MDLETAANVAEVIGGLTVLGGAVFGVIQLHHFRKQRSDAVVVPLIRSFQEPHLAEALRTVMSLPDAADPATVEADPAKVQAAESVNYVIESWGILVFERSTDLHMLDRAGGGVIRAAWRKMRPFVLSRREKYGNPNWGEWFQWLAERVEQYPAPRKSEGAHVAYREWRP